MDEKNPEEKKNRRAEKPTVAGPMRSRPTKASIKMTPSGDGDRVQIIDG